MVDANELAKELQWTFQHLKHHLGEFEINVYNDSIVFQVEHEEGYEDFLVDLTDDVIVEMGYSPVDDFDSIEVTKVRGSKYDGFARFEVSILFNRY